MKAQGFDPALLKFNADQQRVPAGNGRESGRWTSNGLQARRAHHSRLQRTGENEKERGNKERRERGKESPQEHLDHRQHHSRLQRTGRKRERARLTMSAGNGAKSRPRKTIKHKPGDPGRSRAACDAPETAPPSARRRYQRSSRSGGFEFGSTAAWLWKGSFHSRFARYRQRNRCHQEWCNDAKLQD